MSNLINKLLIFIYHTSDKYHPVYHCDSEGIIKLEMDAKGIEMLRMSLLFNQTFLFIPKMCPAAHSNTDWRGDVLVAKFHFS